MAGLVLALGGAGMAAAQPQPQPQPLAAAGAVAAPAERCSAARAWADAEATTPGILQRLAQEQLATCLADASQPRGGTGAPQAPATVAAGR